MSENKITHIVPLYNFQSDEESVKLNDRMCLRHVRLNELNHFKENVPFLEHAGTPSAMLLPHLKHVLEIQTESLLNALENANIAITALRLLKQGEVDFSYVFSLKNNEVFSIAGPKSEIILSTNPYFLKKKEIDDFTSMWKKLQNVKAEKTHLTFPLVQFNKGFEEKLDEDKIVDFMTTFESLIFHKERRTIQPAGKVIGIAIGMLLGKNEKERMKIKKTLTKAYEIRNAKVHGNLKKLMKHQKAVHEVSISVENNLRHVLKKFVEE